jgi:uncharacterized membrane protein
MPKLYSIRPTLTLKGRKFRGIRGWAGKPTHPPLTDFPIVCYVLVAGFDLVSYVAARGDHGRGAHDFFVAGTLVIVSGFLVSLLTALTGFWDWWKGMARKPNSGFIGEAQHTQAWRTANWHMTVMLTVTTIVLVDILIRWSQFDDRAASLTVTILSILAGGLVSLGAAYGGTLVYEYQFNVEDMKNSTVWDETEVDQFPGDRKRRPPEPPAEATT